jgi:hypothetical protein
MNTLTGTHVYKVTCNVKADAVFITQSFCVTSVQYKNGQNENLNRLEENGATANAANITMKRKQKKWKRKMKIMKKIT